MIRTKPRECPVCSYRLDAASGIREEDTKPRPGDYTVCMSCSSVMRFTDNLELKIASTEDMAHLHDEDPESWIVIQEAIKMVLDKPIK